MTGATTLQGGAGGREAPEPGGRPSGVCSGRSALSALDSDRNTLCMFVVAELGHNLKLEV